MLDLRTLQAEAENEPFEFIDTKGRRVRLPHLRSLTPRQALALDRNELDVIEEFAPDLMDLPGYMLEAVIKAWFEHCGIDPGKSQGSPHSSKRRGRK